MFNTLSKKLFDNKHRQITGQRITNHVPDPKLPQARDSDTRRKNAIESGLRGNTGNT